MSPRWMEIMKKDLDERDKTHMFLYVQDGAMTPEYAAGRVSLPVTEFINQMKQNGYTIPARTKATAQ